MSFPPELASNPLVNPPRIPYGAPAWDQIKTEHYEPAYAWALDEYNREIDAIKSNSEPPTFKNTVEALEFALNGDLRLIAKYLDTVANSKTDEDISKLNEKISGQNAAIETKTFQDEALFARFKAIHDAKDALGLTPVQNRLLEKTYTKFARSGALLEGACDNDPAKSKKQRLQEIDARLTELGKRFSANETDSEGSYRKFILDEKELDGVPQRDKDSFRAAAEAEGMKDMWLIRLVPSPDSVFTHCTNRALREELARVGSLVAVAGKRDNKPVIQEELALRHEKAVLMGKANWAEFILQDRMAGNVENVMAMMDRNYEVYKPAAEQYIEKLKALALQDGITELKRWDYAFYDRKLKEQTFSIDTEDLKKYFEVENCVKGMLQHMEKLFHIKYTDATAQYPTFDPDMKVFEIRDEGKPDLRAIVYVDLYARRGEKRGGAWMESIRDRSEKDGVVTPAIVTLNCNIKKGEPGKPTLLTPRDVETLFHEMGHDMHGVLTECPYPSIGGTNVKWDWVELPSQLQENWAMTPAVLQTFARHIETGEVIPVDKIEKIKQMSNFSAGYAGLRQGFLGALDMAYHTTDPEKVGDLEAFENKAVEKYRVLPRDGSFVSPGMGHFFSDPVGYSAGYYSYKWAEILDADAFTRFEQNLYDPEAGAELRSKIYAKGDMEEPEVLMRSFLGREWDARAMFVRDGLAQATPAPVNQNVPGGASAQPKPEAA